MTPRMTKNVGESLRAAGALSTVGLSFVLALGMGFWLGTVLDRWLGTKPLFTIACCFLGLAAGILNVYRIVSQAYPATRPTGAGPAAPGPARAVPSDPTDRDLHDDGDQ
jgi:F0F1-type ATP synthase assembly protein I